MTFDVCNMIGKSNGHLLDINCGIADNVIANSTKMGMSAKECDILRKANHLQKFRITDCVAF